MYNAKYIWLGIILFIAVFTLPFTLNLWSAEYSRPEIVLPEGMEDCIEPVEFMRAEHMTLLNTWRDEALRNENRMYVASDGRTWEASLQNTCMSCHTNKEAFCDTCHTSTNVTPYCWDCHIEPKGNQ